MIIDLNLVCRTDFEFIYFQAFHRKKFLFIFLKTRRVYHFFFFIKQQWERGKGKKGISLDSMILRLSFFFFFLLSFIYLFIFFYGVVKVVFY